MPTNVLPLTPTVRVIFRGFVITRINDGTPSAELAALSTSPCHKPKVKITKITQEFGPVEQTEPQINPTQDFTLAVDNVSDETKGIRVFQRDTDDFNRLDEENDNKDFRWFVNLPALFRKQQLTIDDALLRPIFKMNNALFYTHTLSAGEMRINRTTNGVSASRRFGRFGLDLGANVYLDKPGSRAVLTNGNGAVPLFDVTKAPTADAQTRYVVEFDCNCHIDVEESDFPLIFDVIGAGLSEDEKRLTLEGDPLRVRSDLTPEVYCVAGNLS